jgi:hypothetical protein
MAVYATIGKKGLTMATVGSDEEGMLYDFKDGELEAINMYDPDTLEWINVLEVLRTKYPRSYEYHCRKADKLHAEHMAETACPLTAYKMARDMSLGD